MAVISTQVIVVDGDCDSLTHSGQNVHVKKTVIKIGSLEHRLKFGLILKTHGRLLLK